MARNIAFDVPGGVEVVFSYDLATHVLTVSTRAAGATPDLTQAKAQWLRRGLVAWDVPDADTRRYRLHWSRRRRPGGGCRGRHRRLLGAADPRPGRAAAPTCWRTSRTWPTTRRSGCAPRTSRRCRRSCAGQLAVGVVRPERRARSTRPGCRSPASSTTCTPPPPTADLGVTWSKRAADRRRVGADGAGRRPAGLADPGRRAHASRWSGTPTAPGRCPVRRPGRERRYLFDVRVWSPSAGAVVRNQVTDPYSVGPDDQLRSGR